MLPNELAGLLKKAEESVLAHSKGELILPIRQTIWKIFGESGFRKGLGVAVQTVGLKRRTRLAVLCVKLVMPIWNAAFPTENRIGEIIDMIEDYFNNKIEAAVLRKAQDNLWTRCENIMSEEHEFAAAVGYAACNAASCAVLDNYSGLEELPTGALDEDDDFYSWDTSYWAAGAYSNGGPWEEKSNIPQRREFWMWYIKKAVPEAYEAFED